MSASLLLVEDDASLAGITRRFLTQAGYKVTLAISGEEALALIQKNKPDLVVSDVQLPGISGLKMCEILKENNATASLPIIMVTVLGKTQEKVNGLRTGADDYLTKPFDAHELLARVEAVLRRTRDSGAVEKVINVGPIQVDTARREVTIKGRPIVLRRKEYELLSMFVRKPGRLLTRESLLKALWGDDVVVTPNALEVHIKNLRACLGPSGALIETLVGEGYRLSDR
ncbi:MAG: response regulator transcription factor [Elusimicrobia bacterium]|nr:response regulator transcription factor [Elusimicrobiota bacterium]